MSRPTEKVSSVSEIIEERKNVISHKMSYYPVKIVRGFGPYLYNEEGEQYLDLVNNVAHIGHSNPCVTTAAVKQLQLINTNTRHLGDSLVNYVNFVLKTLPQHQVAFLVNSGSEANEHAIRLARACSPKKEIHEKNIIVMDVAYHGHTNEAMNISSYKFDHPKYGFKPPAYIHKIDMPDFYRGKYRLPKGEENNETLKQELSMKYISDVEKLIEERGLKNNICCFIAESALSCGGQILFHPLYIQKLYELIHKNGGLCIADEIQSGFGRLGSHFWGFEMNGVVPDIVCMGKAVGNGFPLGVVAATRHVQQQFEENAPEFFSSTGGSNLSCEIGIAVLSFIMEQNLQEKAQKLGEFIGPELRRIAARFPEIIGDIRGRGLFWGIDMIADPNTRASDPEIAKNIKHRLLQGPKIFLSTDGRDANVFKIKPPMVIQKRDFVYFFAEFEKILEQVVREKKEGRLVPVSHL